MMPKDTINGTTAFLSVSMDAAPKGDFQPVFALASFCMYESDVSGSGQTP